MPTPTISSAGLSRRAGHPVFLKLETLQPIGAFKIRGAANALCQLDSGTRRRGVVCCSTGNHGRAVAYAAARLGIRATICLSALVPDTKVKSIEALGAKICRAGRSQDDAQVEADRFVGEEQMKEIPAFDDPHVIAGQGTIALELLDTHPDLELIVVPLSGGGLIGGIALAAKAIRPTIRVVGVSMERGAAMHDSLKSGRAVKVTEEATLADSLGGGIGLDNRWTFDLCRRLVDETIVLSEEEIYRGMRTLFLEDRIVAEGAGAVGPAALLAGKLRVKGPVVMIISGQNTDMEQFLAIAGGETVRVGEKLVRG
jgi:threonine dehydratase